MSRKVVKNVLKGVGVFSTVLLGFILTAGNIAVDNRTAISNQLGQSTFEVSDKNKDAKYFKSEYTDLDELIEDGRKLTQRVEEEGAVLLENKGNALPLLSAEDKKVSLFGFTSTKPSYGGRGSSQGHGKREQIDIYNGLKNAGLSINEDLWNYYHVKDSKHPEGGLANEYSYSYQVDDVPWNKDPKYPKLTTISELPDLQKTFEEYSTAIFTITRVGGEASDIEFSGEMNKLKLNKNENEILTALTELKEAGKIKKIIVLLNCTNQIPQKEFEPYAIDSMLWIGHVGDRGLNGVGRILTGEVNPSGRLPDTFYYDHEDNPVMKNFGVYHYENEAEYLNKINANNKGGANGFTTYVAYQEGIYQGYRYSETRYTDVMNKVPNAGEFDYDKVIYRPFGSGLSYTTFEIADVMIDPGNLSEINANSIVTATATIKNTGDVAGKYAVQVYVQKPFGEYAKTNHMEVPAVELVDFGKTTLIPAHSEVEVSLSFPLRNLASYDANKAKTYVLAKGGYKLTIADNAHEAAKEFLAFDGVSIPGATGNEVLEIEINKDNVTAFSKSRATGKDITNIFDKADINKYEGKGDNSLEFLSRTNWARLDKLSNKLHLTQEMVDEINRQQDVKSIKKDEGKYPTYGAENNLLLVQLLDESGKPIDYNDPKWDLLLDQLTWQDTIELITNGLRQTPISGMIGKPGTKDHNGPTGLTEAYLSGNGLLKELIDNTTDPAKKQELSTKYANVLAPSYPSIPVIAATFSKEIASKVGTMMGNDALWAGYNGLYGVGLNSHRSPYEGRQFEYWSEDPLLTGLMAAEEVKGLQAKGCNAYIKHFALNDQESQRFGIQVWSNEQALREISLRPFEYAVIEGGAMNAMSSFSRIGLEFAPASKALMTDFLRGELGMRGFVVTDMYTLGYVQDQMPQFLMAGTDLPDGQIKRSVYEQFKTGYSEVAWQMREAAKRLCYATLASNAMNGFDVNTKVNAITPQWEVALNGASIGIEVFFALSMSAILIFVLVDNKERLFKRK